MLHSGQNALGVLLPLGLEVHLNRHPIPCRGDGGGKELFQGLGAKAAIQLRPPRRGARHHGGNPARFGHLVKAQLPHQLRRQIPGCPAAGIEAVELLLGLDPNQGKAVRAQAVACGLQQRHGSGHGHRRVHRISSCLHHIQADLCPLRNGGTGRRMAGVDHISAGGVGVFLAVKVRHTDPLLSPPGWICPSTERPPGQIPRCGPPHHPGSPRSGRSCAP